jgi:hypothetical protein
MTAGADCRFIVHFSTSFFTTNCHAAIPKCRSRRLRGAHQAFAGFNPKSGAIFTASSTSNNVAVFANTSRDGDEYLGNEGGLFGCGLESDPEQQYTQAETAGDIEQDDPGAAPRSLTHYETCFLLYICSSFVRIVLKG